MRLSEWRAAAPSKDARSVKVATLVNPVLRALGTDEDPHGWIAWGDEPGVRHTILVPTAAGLVTCFVRVNVLGEGPRASAKLVRWNRVEVGELAIETSAGHRLLSFQLEGHVLKGADEAADRIAAFALEVFAAIDGRPRPEPPRFAARPEPRSDRRREEEVRFRIGRHGRRPDRRRPAAARPASKADGRAAATRSPAGRASRRDGSPMATDGALLDPPRNRLGRRARLPPPAPRASRAAPGRTRDLLLQPHELVRPVRPHGDPADATTPVLLRAEGGGHGGGRPEPPDELDLRHGPVPAGQERPAGGDTPGERRPRQRRRSRHRRGGEDPRLGAGAPAPRGRPGLLRPALLGAARPDRPERYELAAARPARPGRGRRAHRGLRQAAARGGQRAD